LTGDTHPDHDTIAKFRRENLPAVHACFVKVLEQAREIGVLKVGTVSVDGTKIRANASKHKNVMYSHAGELIEQLDQEVQALLEEAEKADNAEIDEGQRLPKEVAQREALRAKLKEAREQLEQRAKARAGPKRPSICAKWLPVNSGKAVGRASGYNGPMNSLRPPNRSIWWMRTVD
jgi:hypothetical protein